MNSDIIIIKADAGSLAAHWPWVREGLLDIKASNERPKGHLALDRKELAVSLGQSGRCRWTPEQVRWSILKGLHGNSTIELFFAIGSGEGGERWHPESEEVGKGFFVTSTPIDPIVGCPLDFVLWLVWSGYEGLLEEGLPYMKLLAKERGCTGVEFSSSRHWARRLKTLDVWQMKFETWRLEL